MSARSVLHRRRSWRDDRGLAAVEFALIAPVMLALICGTVDLGYLFMAQSSLTGAVSAAARTSASTQESSQADRKAIMERGITDTMAQFVPPPGGTVTITATAFNRFGDVRPEDYTDANGNGRYDPAAGGVPAEPFSDRNGNGRWDASLPITGTEVGAEGNVVSYTATYPVQHLFPFAIGGLLPYVTLSATAVVRNEPVKTL